MSKSILNAVPFLGTILLLSILTPSAYADVPCPGITPQFSEENPTISGNTILSGAILGDAFVTNGATLTMKPGSCVGKNVFLESGASLVMEGGLVTESVFVKSEGSDASVTLKGNAIVRGDLLVEGNGGSIDVSINGMTGVIIGGDILIKESTGTLDAQNFRVFGDVLIEGEVTGVMISGEGGIFPNPFDVRGDIIIKGANGPVSITETGVAGDVSVEEVTSDDDSLTLEKNRILGDLLLKKNTANNIQINNNNISSGKFLMEGNKATVAGIEITYNVSEDLEMKDNDASSGILLDNNTLSKNILVEKNTGGSFVISNNSAGEKLLCKENNPAPTGSGNTGALEEQCAGLS